MSKKRPNKFSKKEFRESVYDKTDGHCAYCGDPLHIKKFQIDHIICEFNWENYLTSGKHVPPFLTHLTLDDLHHFDNLFATCRSCNGYKDTYSLEGFRVEIEKQLERVNKYSPNYRLAKRYGLVKETPKPIVFYFETLKKYKSE